MSWVTELAELGGPFGAGAIAGLGIAVPLGPIAVLIIETGIRHGWRRAAAAGLGAGTVDLVYAIVAIAAGVAVAAVLEPAIVPLRVVSAVALIAIALRGLAALRARPGGASTGLGDGSLPRTYATVVALTAVNPMTLLYFAALAVGLPALGGAAEGRIAFVAGVGLASAGWQLVLASVGALLHRRLPGRARLATGVAGNVVILLLAANILRAVLAGGAG